MGSLASVYLLSFFFTLHLALPVYIGSSFLGTLVDERTIGLIYAAGAILAIFGLYLIPRLLRAMGDFEATLLFMGFETLAVFGIAMFEDPTVLITLFILSLVLVYLISFDLDVIVEGLSKESSTGTIRGLYLTAGNVAWVLSPVLAAGILTNGDYWRVYLAAAVLFLPALIIFNTKLNRFKDPLYRVTPFFKTLREVIRRRDIRYIFGASFLLNFFFAWMVIYTPIYLHEHLGFDWGNIGVIFSIMLVPFLLLEAPLGRLADKVWGEKEMLSIGFVIIAVSTAAMAFVTDNSFFTWALLLFTTRVGASMVEVMVETYLFKKIKAGESHILSLHRSLRPLSYVIGPLIGAVALTLLPFNYIFLVLGLITLFGLRFSLGIRDTK